MATGNLSDDWQECLEERLQECLKEAPLHEEEKSDDGAADGMISLLEENARLRGLVLRLTDMILRNVVEQG
jgi:hypothetical protein